MLTTIGSIATSMPTASYSNHHNYISHLLNYTVTHHGAKISYKASCMHLHIHTLMPLISVRVKLNCKPETPSPPELPINLANPPPKHNIPILVTAKIINATISSAQEAETGTKFINTKETVSIQQTLHKVGHKQGSAPIQFDNKSATSITNDKVTHCKNYTKAMDIEFYRIQD
jgi:hypothetical protein